MLFYAKTRNFQAFKGHLNHQDVRGQLNLVYIFAQWRGKKKSQWNILQGKDRNKNRLKHYFVASVMIL